MSPFREDVLWPPPVVPSSVNYCYSGLASNSSSQSHIQEKCPCFNAE